MYLRMAKKQLSQYRSLTVAAPMRLQSRER